jgi:CheY-like chemotaxis protein
MALDILIVDDERDIRDLVAGVLSDEGYDCRTAGDSEAALAAVDAQRPSLVLLDVWLHGSPMDGLEVLDAIKAREPDLPLIPPWLRLAGAPLISSKSRSKLKSCCISSAAPPRLNVCAGKMPSCGKGFPWQTSLLATARLSIKSAPRLNASPILAAVY